MDELSAYLLEHYPNNYVTGGDDCNLLIWGTEDAGRHKPKMCSLMLGLEYEPYDLPEEQIMDKVSTDIQNNLTCRKLFWYGSEFAQKMGLTFVVIVYPSMREKFENRWEDSKSEYDPEKVQFYCVSSTDRLEGRTLNGAQLRTMIYETLNVNYTDRGTGKEKNKRLADYFHLWSRDSLTRHIGKFDLDGFLFNEESGKSVLVEFKRSTQTPWIPDWYPKYDKPDYILQNTFAQKIGAGFWLLHHERRVELEEGYVSFFDISGIDDNEPEYFLRFKRRAMKIPLHGDHGLDSIIQNFISAPGTDDEPDLLRCPLCGSPIRNGQYGFFCTGKGQGICDMNPGKHYAYVLEQQDLRSLLAGIPVSYHYNGMNVRLSPKVEPNEYNGRTSHRWKRA